MERPRGPRYLTQDIPIYTPLNQNRLYYSDGEFTPSEEHFVYLYTNRDGHLSIQQERAHVENLLFVISKPIETQNDRRAFNKELQTIQNIITPACDYTPFFTTSQTRLHGPKALKFTYGPHLYNRMSTLSLEIQSLLQCMGIQYIRRIEIARHLVCKLLQDVNGDHIDTCMNFFLFKTDLFHYRLDLDTAYLSLPTTVLNKVEDRHSLYIYDPIRNFVFYPIASDIPSLSVQTTIANSYTLKSYCIIPSSCRSCTFSTAIVPRPVKNKLSFGHVHSEAHIMGLQQQSGHLFHKSMFISGMEQAGTVGVYSATPRLSRQEQLHDIQSLYFLFMSYFRGFNGNGIPIVGGFYKPINSREKEKTVTPLITSSILCVSPADDLCTTRYNFGQVIVALGDFIPTGTFDDPPFNYADSAAFMNPIWHTLHLFRDTLRQNYISSATRTIGHGSVQDNLFALLTKGGARLYFSGLPQQLLAQIQEHVDLTTEDYEDLLYKHYLRVYSSQFYLVLNNTDVNVSGNMTQTVKLIIKYASLCGCSCKILGTTCQEEGLHFFNDLQTSSSDYASVLQRQNDPINNQVFVVHNNNKYRHDLRGTFLERPLVTELDSPFDWESIYSTENIICLILNHPAVGSKEFYVRHGDRCCNGLVAQQSGVGPLDLPLSDYSLVIESAVYPLRCESDLQVKNPLDIWVGDTIVDLLPIEAEAKLSNPETWFVDRKQSRLIDRKWTGHVIGIGEQGYKFLNNPLIAHQYAISEVLTNMMFCTPLTLDGIHLSASVYWDKNGDYKQELETILFSVKEYCADLGINMAVTSACSSTNVTSYIEETYTPKLMTFVGKARVLEGRRVTPELQGPGNTLVHLTVSHHTIIAGSVFEHHMLDSRSPIPPLDPTKVKNLFYLVQNLVSSELIVAGHDISDGGLVTCFIEMALAAQRGITIHIDEGEHPLFKLLSETPGAVVEVPTNNLPTVLNLCEQYECQFKILGQVGDYGPDKKISIKQGHLTLFEKTVSFTLNEWRHFSDNQYLKLGAQLKENEMYRHMYGENEINLHHLHTICINHYMQLYKCPVELPKVAILCMPGCPQPTSLLSAFTNVGFGVSVIYISNLKSANSLNIFTGLAVSGISGYSHGYIGCRAVIQAALASHNTTAALKTFFNRGNTFSLCCGEMGFELLSTLNVIGGDNVPNTRSLELEQNLSKLYECLWLNFHIPIHCKSIMLSCLSGLTLPGWISGTHMGIRYLRDAQEYILRDQRLICLEFHSNLIDGASMSLNYPRNPTGNSTVAGICDHKGRHLALLCDPSLMFHPWQWQYQPPTFKNFKTSPWALPFQQIYLRCLKEINM
ncbi:ORF75 [Felid gammaherpesvirus 1]|uniref:ORF75 n=1 Tax=Felid gammaherpesvirus 1 TaxID=2560468 RepID=A0A0M4LRU9_9GAMA|nr:ORF75 [Felis catus gammaherpesvirus 1]ALE14791.1 ORF75 [Felis catus gammaherpesvirus 1]